MLSPAAIVSTAGFVVPLWALWKKMLPTKTSPTGWPPPPGEVTPPHPASSVAATINGMRRMLLPPRRIVGRDRGAIALGPDNGEARAGGRAVGGRIETVARRDHEAQEGRIDCRFH